MIRNSSHSLPIVERITSFLATVDNAAPLVIAAAIGEALSPNRVKVALTAMLKDGVIECEKDRKSKVMRYWLTNTRASGAQSQPEVDKNTGSSAPDNSVTVSTGGAAVQKPAPEAAPPAPVAEDDTVHVPELTKEDYLPPAEMDTKALAGYMRALAESIKPTDPLVSRCVAASAERLEQFDAVLKELDEVRQIRAVLRDQLAAKAESFDDLRDFIGRIAVQLTNIKGADIEHKVAQVCHDLIQTTIKRDELQAQIDEALDVKDVAVGYLVRAPKRKPRVVTKPETAVDIAKAAARGAGRGDVYALVHVGTARRDAVYQRTQP